MYSSTNIDRIIQLRMEWIEHVSWEENKTLITKSQDRHLRTCTHIWQDSIQVDMRNKNWNCGLDGFNWLHIRIGVKMHKHDYKFSIKTGISLSFQQLSHFCGRVSTVDMWVCVCVCVHEDLYLNAYPNATVTGTALWARTSHCILKRCWCLLPKISRRRSVHSHQMPQSTLYHLFQWFLLLSASCCYDLSTYFKENLPW